MINKAFRRIMGNDVCRSSSPVSGIGWCSENIIFLPPLKEINKMINKGVYVSAGNVFLL